MFKYIFKLGELVNKTIRWLFCFTCFVTLNQNLNAQNTLSNVHTRIFYSATSNFIFDSLSIIPNSVKFESLKNKIPTELILPYRIVNTTILIDSSEFFRAEFPLKVTYRVFNYNFGKKVFTREIPNFKLVAPTQSISQSLLFADGLKSIFDKELDYSGNYTQGFSTGNTQNVTVNQNFNLNVAGKLGDVEILAAMSDNNVPIQAQGNTLQLREIERIFIQLKKDNLSLIAGDYELYRPNSYFLNYQKKLQGATFTGIWNLKNEGNTNKFIPTLKLKTSAAISKGKFARNVLQVQEGNQGPYRLTGNSASNYFIVLSGTEKVFFDGKPLVRGEENDYVIDYNSGTIQFMPRTLVTREARIVVEFEYSDQNYLRSILATTAELQFKKTKISINLYSEQDSKNSSGVQSLDSLDKQILLNSNNVSEIISPSSIRAVQTYSANIIQYTLSDTVINGKTYVGILIFSTNSKQALYTASFSPVAQGTGNYVADDQNYANGRVYKWIAPDAQGNKLGNFEPIKRLIPPNQQQMASIGIEQNLGSHLVLNTETALSYFNPNTFSINKDSALSRGALNAQLMGNWFLDSARTLKLSTQTKFEYVQNGFRPLNPYRNAEFSRDWNISSAAQTSNTSVSVGSLDAPNFQTSENWFMQSLSLEKNGLGSIQYSLSTYNRDSLYSGVRQNVNMHLQKKFIYFDAQYNDLHSTSTFEKTDFQRPNATLSFNLDKYKIGFTNQTEINQRRNILTDTLLRSAYYFVQNQFFIEKIGKNFWRLAYSRRQEFTALSNAFGLNNLTDELTLNGSTATTATQIFSWNATYRNLEGSNINVQKITPQKTYLARLEYIGNFAKRFLKINTLYEIGSGREQKLEYQFIKVNKGEGQYIWRKKNESDSVPKISDFELAPYSDQGEYVRVALFSNQFQNIYNTSVSQSFNLDPSSWNKSSLRIKKILSHVSALSTLSISRRVSQSVDIDAVFNPYKNNIPDTSLIGLNTTSRNSIFINRSGTTWELELSSNASRQRNTYVTGFEERAKSETYARLRYNFTNITTSQIFLSRFELNSNTENFLDRNYQIKGFKFEPQLTFFLNKNARLTTQYKFKSAQNILKTEGEQLTLNELSTEFTLNAAKSSQLRAKITGTVVNFINGDANSATGFAILEGFQNGNNFIWNLTYDKSLSQNLLLSLSYEGRNLGAAPVSHVGRMQIRASF